MSNNLPLERQIASLEELVRKTPVSLGERRVWNTSRARAGFKANRIFPTLASIPISDRNARAKVSVRYQYLSSQVY